MRTYIKAYMSSYFGQIPPLTTELAALERLKIDVITKSPLILIRSFSNLIESDVSMLACSLVTRTRLKTTRGLISGTFRRLTLVVLSPEKTIALLFENYSNF